MLKSLSSMVHKITCTRNSQSKHRVGVLVLDAGDFRAVQLSVLVQLCGHQSEQRFHLHEFAVRNEVALVWAGCELLAVGSDELLEERCE